VTGVEMNQYFCDVSREMLEKHGMADRAQVIQADIRDRADLLKAADVIILNNVFEFFFEHDQQAAFWVWGHRTASWASGPMRNGLSR
jgi:hypothetical protein